MFSAYQKIRSLGEYFWQDFITAFRPHTIRSYAKPALCEEKDLFIQKETYVDPHRTRSSYESDIDLLYISQHIVTDYHKSCKATVHVENLEEEDTEKLEGSIKIGKGRN